MTQASYRVGERALADQVEALRNRRRVCFLRSAVRDRFRGVALDHIKRGEAQLS